MRTIKINDDNRAVSPVIGVILMVAITVILAAVIASFVLGLGDQTAEPTPNPTIQSDYNNDEVDFSVTGGDDFVSGDSTFNFEITVQGVGQEGSSGSGSATVAATITGSVGMDQGNAGVSYDSTSFEVVENNFDDGTVDPAAGLSFDNNKITFTIDTGDEVTAGDGVNIALDETDAFDGGSNFDTVPFDADEISGWEVEIVWNPADQDSDIIYSDSS